MNTYVWILLALLCAVAIPAILTSVSRCKKCHGFCEDEEACKAKRELDHKHETERQAHEQKENNHPA